MEQKSKILLVDDEELVREELGGLLSDEGYQVVVGADGQQGLELFKEQRPDLVITDVRMPRVTGLELVAAIREASPDTPVTVITGHGTEEMAIQALRAGVTDFIKKPVRVDDLNAALARMETALHFARHDPSNLPSAAHLVERVWTYELTNERAAIPDFVDVLLTTCSTGADRGQLMELSLALRELILNAVEHGNLALTYEEKTTALEAGRLEELLIERARQPELVDRRVLVKASRTDKSLAVEVTDQGKGFNWRSLPDPTDPSYLLADHGRGVLLAQLSVDELRYSEAGNQVTIVKNLS
jgi:FixJ family two-component response regulator/anti-sigma regulatory factor (Ser/Thr protein kinase)